MKKKLLIACLAFSMSASAQKKDICIKSHCPLEMYRFSEEYCDYYKLDYEYYYDKWYNVKWDYSNTNVYFYWSPKYFVCNQDTIVLTYKFRNNELYNAELYLERGNYRIKKIAEKLWIIIKN